MAEVAAARNRIAGLRRLRDAGIAETEDGDLVDEAIERQIALLWRTRPLRRERLFVADEVETALSYLRDVFLTVIPALQARWERALGARPPSFLKAGSWIGGDRDGNPYVNADSLSFALHHASAAALAEYLEQLHQLGAELSLSSELAQVSPALEALAARLDGAMAEPFARAVERVERVVVGLVA